MLITNNIVLLLDYLDIFNLADKDFKILKKYITT
jgi:hypothetical protein